MPAAFCASKADIPQLHSLSGQSGMWLLGLHVSAHLTSVSVNEVCSCHLECHRSQESQRRKAVSTKRATERIQWVEVLAAEPEDASSSSKTHVVTDKVNFRSLSSDPWVSQSSMAWERALL